MKISWDEFFDVYQISNFKTNSRRLKFLGETFLIILIDYAMTRSKKDSNTLVDILKNSIKQKENKAQVNT